MYYNKTHSINFIISGETKNTYDDWHLVPTSRPSVAPPEVQDFSTVLDARHGKIDYYNSIIQYPIYRNRTGTFEFLIDHEAPDYYIWHYTYDQIMNFLHGRHGQMILKDQPDYYYEGSFTVSEFASNSDWSTISIGYDVYPMKKSIIDSQEPWLWDPFSFLTGIIRFAKDFTIEVPVGKEKEFTVEDVRGVSEIGLEFDDNYFGGSNAEIGTPFYNYSTKIQITLWDPIAGDITKRIYVNDNIDGRRQPFHFMLYPGHEKFKILVSANPSGKVSDPITFKIHYREGVL